MNDLYVNIKVDREERPDLDKIYQTSHQLLTGQAGGWPLTVFLTPGAVADLHGHVFSEGAPLRHAGVSRGARRDRRVLPRQGDEIRERGASLVEALGSMQTGERRRFRRRCRARRSRAARERLRASLRRRARRLRRRAEVPACDDARAAARALARAPRTATDAQALAMVTHTLDCMAQRGLYDHLGGGFFRYSVDRLWAIPHFEKMLYDNAQLLARLRRRVRGDGHAAVCERRERDGGLGHARHAGRARRLLLDARRRLRARGRQVLRLDAGRIRRACSTPGRVGAREARLRPGRARRTSKASTGICNSPRRPRQRPRRSASTRLRAGELLEAARAQVARRARAARLAGPRREAARLVERPHDRRHGARGARARRGPSSRESATRAVDFIRAELWRDGRLKATYKDGRARFAAYLDDYAFLAYGLLELLQTRWRDERPRLRARARRRAARALRGPARRLLLHGRRSRAPDPQAEAVRRRGRAGGQRRRGARAARARPLARRAALSRRGRAHRARGAARARSAIPDAHATLLRALEELLDAAEARRAARDAARSSRRGSASSRRSYEPHRLAFAIPNDAEAVRDCSRSARRASEPSPTSAKG